MKKSLLSWLMLCLAIIANAQKFDVDTINWTGSVKNRVNYVFLAEGYSSSTADQTKFISDSKNMMNQIFNTVPYKEYKSYVNIFIIKVISNQSGASHPKNSSDNSCGSQPTATVDNYFGSGFDCGGGGYHRLLCATKESKLAAVMAANFPNYHQALFVVNTPYYGGAGGTNATTSTESSGVEIAIHEIGHSFAKLADEYWAGSQYASEKANMTATSNTSSIKWNTWVGTESVGAFQYSGGTGWYRPVNGTCKMEYLGSTYKFCPVCREAHVEKFHSLVRPYDTISPVSNSAYNFVTNSVDFKLNTVLPIPNTLKITWSLNGSIQKTVQNASINTLKYSDLLNGSNTLTATIIDTTKYARITTHATSHKYIVTWNINKTSVTGLDISTHQSEFEYSFYPNPVSEILTIKTNINTSGMYQIYSTDLNGNKTKIKDLNLKVGLEEIKIPVFQLSKGAYIFSIEKDNLAIFDEKIIIE